MKAYTLVMGASENVQRYSNMAIRKLKQFGHNVYAHGLKKGEVDGIEITQELEPFKEVDTVTLYLNPTNQKSYYDYILGLKPRRVIFNPGTENPDLYNLLTQNNIAYEEACTLVLLNTKQY